MSNIVEFVIRMKDMMSGGLERLASTSQSVFNRVSQHANNVMSRNSILGQSFEEIQRRIQAAESTIRSSTIPSLINLARRELASLLRLSNRNLGNTGRSNDSGGSNNSGGSGGSGGSGSGIVSSMSRFISNKLMGAAGNILGGIGNKLMGIGGKAKDAIIGAAGEGLSGSIKKEQAITGLSTFLGKDNATEAYTNIRKDASVSPYNTESLLEANRALISAGLNAKDAREDSMNLANAISAVGGGNAQLTDMASNMQRIKIAGKASSNHIEQFGAVGINIYEMLARSTGKSIDQVKNMDISYNELAKSLAMARSKGGIYEGALEAQGNTMGAKIEQIKGKFSNALVDIADRFTPVITKVLDVAIKMADGIDPLLQKAQPYIDMIANGLGIAIDYIISLTSGTSEWGDWIEIAVEWYSNVWDFLKKIGTIVGKVLSGLMEWVSKSELIKDTIKFIHTIFEMIFKVIGSIGEILLWWYNNVVSPILEALEKAYRWVKEMLGSSDNKLTIEVNKEVKKDKPAPLKPPPAPTLNTDLTGLKEKNLISDTDNKTRKNKESSKKTGDTISSGGSKVINITLGKFFETIQFTTMNNTESRDELEKMLMELMGRVLYNGAKIM